MPKHAFWASVIKTPAFTHFTVIECALPVKPGQPLTNQAVRFDSEVWFGLSGGPSHNKI